MTRFQPLRIPLSEALLLVGLVLIGGITIVFTISASPSTTVLLLIAVSIAGLYLCRETVSELKDPLLNRLGVLWLVKLGITLVLLYAGWIPDLNFDTSASWGYDPQRYYSQANELLVNDWSPDLLAINYAGILYFYAGIFYALGHNPVVPTLLNALLTLIASLLLVRVGYGLAQRRTGRHWMLALVLLLPETLWFDVMTSRESLLAALLLFAMLTPGRYFARMSPLSGTSVVLVTGLCIFGIAAVRTSLVLPVFVSIILMASFIGPAHKRRPIRIAYLALFGSIAVLLTSGLFEIIGGSSFDWGHLIGTAITSSDNIALSDEVEWSQNSVGSLLIPSGTFQAALFLVPRMALYVIAPLPNIPFTFGDLIDGKWAAWQGLSFFLSSIINVIVMPFAVGSLVHSFRQRNFNAAPLVLHIPYWVMFIAIAGGNLIIHERYRVMISALFWGCAWLGARTCPRKLLLQTSLAWYSALIFGTFFYIFYKFSRG